MFVSNLESIRIKLASSQEILSWSYGEITKPETINYRTQRPEKDGLFCEKIFGPTRDYECYCGKYKRIRYKGVVCDRCGVEVTKSSVRRERMGHIKLAAPVSHIWFLKGVPSRIGTVLDLPFHRVEEIIYFLSYIVISVNEEAKKGILEEIEREYKAKLKDQKASIEDKKKQEEAASALKTARDKAKEELVALRPLKVLSELEYSRLALKYGEIFEAGTGAETLKRIFEEIDLGKEIKEMEESEKRSEADDQKKAQIRMTLFKEMRAANIRPEWMFLDVLPVLPPDLRPMVQLDGGRYASSDLNDLYRRVINRNNRLKHLLEINAPEVIVRNEKRMLQEAVDSLIDSKMRKGATTLATTGGRRLLKSLADMLQGKQGRFRQNLLGKRVDYSGRSVIVVGPNLHLNECGVPKKMALELFKPFVVKKLIERELVYNMGGAKKLIEEETDEVWECLEEAVQEKLVLLNRAPTLHRLGIQAFKPVLIEGEAIRISPYVCAAFNADFDGDQMAIHLPLSDEAQTEARERMMSPVNLLKPATSEPIVLPSKDVILGCYHLTKIIDGKKGEGKAFCSPEEAIMAYELGVVDLQAKVKVLIGEKMLETSAGRVIFNKILPEEFEFQNYLLNSKTAKDLVKNIIEKDEKGAWKVLDNIKNIGLEYATKSGISWGMDDLIVPEEKKILMKEAEEKIQKIEDYFRQGLLSQKEKATQAIEIWKKVKTDLEKIIPTILPVNGPVFSMIDSKSKGSWGQVVQMAGIKGLVSNPAGRIIELPVKSSFKEGFDVLEYFISTHGARKGTADTALRTSSAGYLTRRLVDVAHEVIVTEEDCRDSNGIILSKAEADEIGQDFSFKILGRTTLEDIINPETKEAIVKKGNIIDWRDAEKISKMDGIEEVRVRSPLSCKTKRGICSKCYGSDLGWGGLVNLGEAVGVVAAQSIGEPGTQLTMRTFHTGGVAESTDITYGLPRVEEIFEKRLPKGEASIAFEDGKVASIDEEKGIIKIISSEEEAKKKSSKKEEGKKDLQVNEYQVPPKVELLVKVGQEIKAGTPLCVGPLDMKKLFKLKGKEAVQRYIIREVQKVYSSQGVPINDKHIEIIIRQMFSRVKVKNSGGSLFSPGEVISRTQYLEAQEKLKEEKKDPIKAQELLLGISKVALTCDSFLSAVSFQETSRVLIKASLKGAEDKLRGLKENVIIGKLVPVGTGFTKKEPSDS
jgi:DNA-directed RNA polymerase subunit beta'